MLETLWVDKYRPRLLTDLTYHHEINAALAQLATTNDFPHLIFYGPEGAGKKTRVITFIQEVFGVNSLQLTEEERTLKPQGTTKTIEYTIFSSHHHIQITPSDNENDDRFIIQNVVKEIASSKTIGSKGKEFKVLVINQADRLSKEAQGSLRRTMEKYITHCRMILVCKNVHKLIMPIRSRCMNLRVPAPSNDDIANYLVTIAQENGLEISQQTIKKILKSSGRNMRDAISQLECYRYSKKPNDLMHPYKPEIQEIAKLIIKEQSPAQLQKIRGVFYDLLVNCVPGSTILKLVLEEIIYSGQIRDQILKGLIHEASRLEVTLSQGSKAIIHLECFAAHAMEAVMATKQNI